MTLVKTSINRRSFLKVSAASGSGLLIGFNWLASCTQQVGESIPEEWFDVNAFIKIADNGLVTIFSPNPEVGQNVKTAMPMIVAEELDAAWEQVRVEQADLDTNSFQRQVAGGSGSIRSSWSILRMAGATARRMLVEAAAKRWQVSIEQVTTDKGILKNTNTGDELNYGEVAVEAASIQVPEEVPLKDPQDFQLIGTSVKNVDGPKIVTGAPLFGLDYDQEGQTLATIVHAPAFGMKLKSFNATAVKAMDGISDVFTIDISLDNRRSRMNAFNEMIVITGTSTWPLMNAKKALVAEWEADGALESSEDHERLLRDAIDNQRGEVARQDGNPDQMIARGHRVIERTYSAPFLPHNAMEPMNFFADVTADKAVLVGPIQTPERLRGWAAELLDMPEDKVLVKMTRMGGGFGRRLYGNFGLEAAAISQKIGGPVKLIYSREDDMTHGIYRPAYRVKYTATIDENNELSSWQVKGAGIPSSPLFANRFPAGTLDNFKSVDVGVETKISTGAWRAPRSNFIAGAEQSFMDEVAEAAGKDPIEFRLALFNRAMENPVGDDNDYDAERYAGVLELVKEKANWGQPTPGVYRGVAAYYCHRSYVAQVVDVVLKGNTPKVQKVWCAVDCGIVVNKEGAINQLEGGIIDGIGHAMYSQITFADGAPRESNFNDYRLIKNGEAPAEIEVFFVDNGIDPTGLGEPSLPPVIGALANALYQATGNRYYHQPFMTSNQKIELG